ncbi:MAG: UDP-N-acetylmuramoyl-tripeptide--D-alanyl-D-alanine ligase [Candidatus Acidiferrales bacterium]
MRWTVGEVAGALGVAAAAGVDPLAWVAGVSIDSRTVRGGELFVAIHGPRHDGHAFVGAALDAGAVAAVVARERAAEYPGAVRRKLIVVERTLDALQELARGVRRRWGKRIAAVTGSTGKTTTKEILAQLLGARLRVLKSEGNLNNDYGLPLSLARLEREHEAAVLELGMSRKGELARLAKIAEPEVGVVTNVAPVHLEFFASVDEIALAKRELIEGLAGAAPVAVLNADDARVEKFAEGFRGRVLRFGIEAAADFRAENVLVRRADGSAFDCVTPAWRARLELALPGAHNIRNALAAIAAASVWGITAEEAQRGLRAVRPAAMRGEVLRLEPGITVLNDCYNSNPVALAATVDLLAGASDCRRRVLVAGEMLELGATSAELHREAGRSAARRVDWIFGVQGDAAELVEGAVAAGHEPGRARFFGDSEQAAEFLSAFVEKGDLVLVKGSRGVKMERIVEGLKARHRETSQAVQRE